MEAKESEEGGGLFLSASLVSLSLISLLGDVLYNSAWTLAPSLAHSLPPLSALPPPSDEANSLSPLFSFTTFSPSPSARPGSLSKNGDGGEAICKTEMHAELGLTETERASVRETGGGETPVQRYGDDVSRKWEISSWALLLSLFLFPLTHRSGAAAASPESFVGLCGK